MQRSPLPGHTTSEIALQLGIATKTVEHHLESVYRKLGIKSRRELMRKRFSGDLDLSQAILPAPADQDDSDGENSYTAVRALQMLKLDHEWEQIADIGARERVVVGRVPVSYGSRCR